MIRQLILQVSQWLTLIEMARTLDDHSNAFDRSLKALARKEGDEMVISGEEWVKFNKKWNESEQLGQWLDDFKMKARAYMDTRPVQPSQPSIPHAEPSGAQPASRKRPFEVEIEASTKKAKQEVSKQPTTQQAQNQNESSKGSSNKPSTSKQAMEQVVPSTSKKARMTSETSSETPIYWKGIKLPSVIVEHQCPICGAKNESANNHNFHLKTHRELLRKKTFERLEKYIKSNNSQDFWSSRWTKGKPVPRNLLKMATTDSVISKDIPITESSDDDLGDLRMDQATATPTTSKTPIMETISTVSKPGPALNFPCDLCDRIFDTRNGLSNHRRRHRNPPPTTNPVVVHASVEMVPRSKLTVVLNHLAKIEKELEDAKATNAKLEESIKKYTERFSKESILETELQKSKDELARRGSQLAKAKAQFKWFQTLWDQFKGKEAPIDTKKLQRMSTEGLIQLSDVATTILRTRTKTTGLGDLYAQYEDAPHPIVFSEDELDVTDIPDHNPLDNNSGKRNKGTDKVGTATTAKTQAPTPAQSQLTAYAAHKDKAHHDHLHKQKKFQQELQREEETAAKTLDELIEEQGLDQEYEMERSSTPQDDGTSESDESEGDEESNTHEPEENLDDLLRTLSDTSHLRLNESQARICEEVLRSEPVTSRTEPPRKPTPSMPIEPREYAPSEFEKIPFERRDEVARLAQTYLDQYTASQGKPLRRKK
jgi:hypothetical protein